MREIFSKALGIDKPWFVTAINFDAAAKRLDISIDFVRGSTFSFEQAGIIGHYKAYDTVEKEWRHLNFFEHECWLSENQSKIEDRLFRLLPQESMNLFLYDVTSSYFEGVCNELAAFGYNRDGKRGKQQIVVGLLCNADGIPVSVQVFEGNTQDPKTLTAQLRHTTKRFGVKEITWVGDRGMIKSAQIKQISEEGFHYITLHYRDYKTAN